jgi:hypothetical protein
LIKSASLPVPVIPTLPDAGFAVVHALAGVVMVALAVTG